MCLFVIFVPLERVSSNLNLGCNFRSAQGTLFIFGMAYSFDQAVIDDSSVDHPVALILWFLHGVGVSPLFIIHSFKNTKVWGSWWVGWGMI